MLEGLRPTDGLFIMVSRGRLKNVRSSQPEMMVYQRSWESFPEIQYARTAPANWARMNPGVPVQRIPENVFVRLLAIVTAGLANDVDDVHQYAEVI